MRHPLAALGAVLLAGVLTLFAPLGARAATGTFSYFTDRGVTAHELANPVDGRCYPVGYAHGVTGNETDRDAYLYDTPDCRGAAAYFPKGFYRLETFQSVVFMR
ncbi:hypothetical protein BLA24_09325 [Streptomyces cinnamoneus]|uniref:Uncharacterized protein n=1 Tax=Streptomyces cinnamoneus TaxID=53446 RepID=A0A2G1XLJ4_STRCJ|nr:hypothetical protein [Streptomyces cinnamoneus]PHQ52113.1 hypothetical protein BLA24_09325 [Streptomyces cinnamoneus]PPT16193.1 hypothetical protein CYQ11_27935 [Streptomyces cinnamoneus]